MGVLDKNRKSGLLKEAGHRIVSADFSETLCMARKVMEIEAAGRGEALDISGVLTVSSDAHVNLFGDCMVNGDEWSAQRVKTKDGKEWVVMHDLNRLADIPVPGMPMGVAYLQGRREAVSASVSRRAWDAIGKNRVHSLRGLGRGVGTHEGWHKGMALVSIEGRGFIAIPDSSGMRCHPGRTVNIALSKDGKAHLRSVSQGRIRPLVASGPRL